jgi:hypothetical protein
LLDSAVVTCLLQQEKIHTAVTVRPQCNTAHHVEHHVKHRLCATPAVSVACQAAVGSRLLTELAVLCRASHLRGATVACGLDSTAFADAV